MKRYRKLPLVIGSLSAIALGTVGFSAWIITGGTANGDTGNISVTAGAVDDQRMSLSIKDIDETGIKFEPRESDKGPIYYDGYNKEDLDFNFTITIKNSVANVTSVATYLKKVTISYKNDLSSEFKQLVDENYVTTPIPFEGGCVLNDTEINEALKIESGKVITRENLTFTFVTSSDSRDLDIICNLKYGWGSQFGNKAPNQCLMDHEKNLSDVLSELNYIRETLTAEGKTFALEVNVNK